VELFTVTDAGSPPMVTVVEPRTKPVPLMVITVPPATGPALGEGAPTIVGAAADAGKADANEVSVTKKLVTIAINPDLFFAVLLS
jgi:hypothetical protein